MWYAGIDLHRRTAVVAMVDDDKKQVRTRTFQCSRPHEIVEFVSKHRPFRAVIEARMLVGSLVSGRLPVRAAAPVCRAGHGTGRRTQTGARPRSRFRRVEGAVIRYRIYSGSRRTSMVSQLARPVHCPRKTTQRLWYRGSLVCFSPHGAMGSTTTSTGSDTTSPCQTPVQSSGKS